MGFVIEHQRIDIARGRIGRDDETGHVNVARLDFYLFLLVVDVVEAGVLDLVTAVVFLDAFKRDIANRDLFGRIGGRVEGHAVQRHRVAVDGDGAGGDFTALCGISCIDLLQHITAIQRKSRRRKRKKRGTREKNLPGGFQSHDVSSLNVRMCTVSEC
ncbi:hypothetical protein AGRO_2536 [Agrobacterium sp. ATCC 31749]|nr:hypothetical protein AGRO_2536 [Agrobacterium sp. ATCC 31749]